MYKKSNKGWLKHLDFMIIDTICLQLSFILAYFIRQGVRGTYVIPLYQNMFLLLFLIQFLITFTLDSFKNVLKRGLYKEFLETFKHCSLIILATVFYFFLTQTGEQYSRLILLLTGTFYAILSFLARILWKKHLILRGISGKGKRSLLLITCHYMASTVLENLNTHNYGEYQISGIVIVDDDMVGQTIDGITVVAKKENVLDFVRKEWVDQVFINLPHNISLSQNILDGFTEMGVAVHQKLINTELSQNQKWRVEKMGGYIVLTSSINMASSKQLFLKRSLDIIGGFVGCIITGIICIVLAPCIYIKSPGPIFFSQYRIGKNGKKFKIYKFRSMYMDAEQRKKELLNQNRIKDGMMFKLDHDPRIIGGERGLGGTIRRLSLDEWPQMWNILKGEMSLVGTRPPTLDEWERYELHHRARLSIKPGLTGLWQISGRSDITDFEEIVKLDKKYISEWNIKTDIKILLKTVKVVLYKEGAL